MKKQFCKTMSYVMTAALLLGVSMPSSPAAAKKKAPKLSTKKVSISVGQKKTIKLKNGKKAVWSIKSGKKVVSLSKKKKTSVVVKGKKAGKAVVLAKVGKKKLTCKVTVKAKKPAVTKAPAVTTAPNTNKPSTAPTATPTAVVPAPTATPEQGEAVKDITIDMTKVGDTEFSSSPATINFSSQLDARFDLAYFKEVKIGYELTFEGEDTSKLTAGKIAVAGTTEQLTGFDDGVAFNYNMAAGATSVSVAFDEKVTGPAVGFEVANHSYDSNGLNSVGPEVIKEKIAKTDALLSEITGYKHFLFRAPNVAYSQAMYAVIEKPFIDVSIWSQDYQDKTTKDDLVNNVINNLKDGGIINMHSVHDKTAEAVPEILEQCKDKGYQVVGVSELFAIKGKKLMTGVKYNNAE